MEFAYYNAFKTIAAPGLKGLCPHCDAEVIAKCGSKKIWHWAHARNQNCDPWFEPETQWHRDWKNKFGKEFSEVRVEKVDNYHIADIINHQNIVFEFQNSSISAETIQAREAFYGERMLWIINGNPFKDSFHRIDANFKKDWNLTAIHEFEMANHYKAYENHVLIEDWKVKSEAVQGLLQEQEFKYVPEAKVYAYPLSQGVQKEAVVGKLFDELMNLYEQQKEQNDYIKGEFIWERPRTSWEEAKRPVFIDFGEDYLYRITSQPGRKFGEGVKVSKKLFLEKYASY